MANRDVPNKTTAPEASRPPPFPSQFSPAGSRRPDPAVPNATMAPEASRPSPFPSQFSPAGSRRPDPAVPNATMAPEASRPSPFPFPFSPAGSQQPDLAVPKKTTALEASRPPPFPFKSSPAGSQRPNPAVPKKTAARKAKAKAKAKAPRRRPFFSRLFQAGRRRPGPAREPGTAHKTSTAPQTPRLSPCCFRFSRAGRRRPGPAMENGAVYNKTTEPEAKAPRRWPCGCTLRHLRGWRLLVKVVQTILSFVAVVCEEIVEECSTCSGLYFFEFISCSAFLLSLLILYMYCTDLYESLGEEKVQKLNFWAVPVIGACFLLASIVFCATGSGDDFEDAACAFGFLATFAFAAEFGVELFLRRKQKIPRCPENPCTTPRAAENQPLNKQR